MSNQTSGLGAPAPYSKIRSILWPVNKSELGKFIPMSALMFCVLFNQNVLRILKDSILISEIGAEITSFAKLYCVTPVAALFVIMYSKMVNHLPYTKIFYLLVSGFMAFYALFAFVIYPNIEIFHMNAHDLHCIMQQYPHLKWYIAIFGNWSYIAFYTLSELWPNIFYVLLFWQLANEITTTNEAKRFYTLFALFGNSSLVVVGIVMMYLSSNDNCIIRWLVPYFGNSETKIFLVQISSLMIILSAILSMFLVRQIANNVMGNPELCLKTKFNKSIKNKLTLVESFKYITSSKYLWLMLVCSASFGLSMNLVEAVWKSKINELYPSVNDYAAFNSLYILWTGIAIIIMTLIGNNMIRAYNWFVVAVISPIIIMITGTCFFILVVFGDDVITVFEGMIFTTPLALAVFIGALQNILSKGSKYSLWDTSREMLYIPLDSELRTKGKAAVDVVSSKLGKSLSGLIQSMIFTFVPMATYASISPILMCIFMLVCIVWIYAVRKIYFEYQKIA